MHFLCLTFLSVFWKLAVGQTVTSPSAGSTPSCLQPRQSSYPTVSAIDSVLASAIPNACNAELEESITDNSESIRTYHIQSFNFNISQDAASQVTAAASACINAFQSIVSTCIDSSNTGFWGGWIFLDALNYSISDPEHPKNAFLAASSTLDNLATSSNARETGSPPSGVTNTGSGLAPTNLETTAVDIKPTGFQPSGSINVVSGTADTNPSNIQGPTVSGSHAASSRTGFNPSNTVEQSRSSSDGTATGQSGVDISNTINIQPSSAPSGSKPVTSSPIGTGTDSSIDGTGSGATGTGNSPLSGDLTGTRTSSGGSAALSGFSFGASQSSGTTSSLNIGLSSDQNTHALSSTRNPSGQMSSVPLGQDTIGLPNTNVGTPSNQNPSDPSSTASQGDSRPDTTEPGNGPITPPPVIPTTLIDQHSPQATSDGVIIGGLLFGLSKSAKSLSNDITIPDTKTAFLKNIEDTEHQLETLYKDMGGTVPPDTGGCSGGARRKKRGLGSLVGDVFNTVRCAINSLDTLKGHLNVPEPDISTIEGDLDDVGTLGENVDKDNENDNDNSSSDNQESTRKQTEEPSTNDPSTNEPSTRPSSSRPSSASATTTGTRSSTGNTCGGCCPTEEPLLPTDGTPAVTAAPTDFDTIDKRVVPPGRLRRLVKRRDPKPLPKLNGCNLQTPNNMQVTIPAYPGGFEFYTSVTMNQLGKLTSISRYYRSTTTGEPACTPTITQINAAQWTFSQSGSVPENDKVSVDHAYEIGFLKSFMESIIDKSDGINCEDANAQFFDQGDQGSCPDNRLEPIFGSLPSYRNPDFVAMSQWLNGDAKGWVLGPDYDPQLGGANLVGNKVRAKDNWATAMKKIKNKMTLPKF